MFAIPEHTADVGCRATANNLPESFENAAQALVATAMETSGIQPCASYALAAQGGSHESLQVNWLSEVSTKFTSSLETSRHLI